MLMREVLVLPCHTGVALPPWLTKNSRNLAGVAHMQSGEPLSTSRRDENAPDDSNQRAAGQGSRRRRGAEGLTVDYLEDNGLFDMPIQVASFAFMLRRLMTSQKLFT
jgi:hypothetical protein